jgi:hypothetical protein
MKPASVEAAECLRQWGKELMGDDLDFGDLV